MVRNKGISRGINPEGKEREISSSGEQRVNAY